MSQWAILFNGHCPRLRRDVATVATRAPGELYVSLPRRCLRGTAQRHCRPHAAASTDCHRRDRGTATREAI